MIEPYLTDQWYVDAKTLAKPAMAAVRSGETTFVPKNWEKTYFEWMENIQPWCISRQLWWGHQIPAWYGPDGKVFVAETEEEAVSHALGYYVEQEVITAEQGREMALDRNKREGFITRDEDVLDTWFSSALWPFSTLGWPDDAPEVKRYYPTNALVTGFDIIFFWVARMPQWPRPSTRYAPRFHSADLVGSGLNSPSRKNSVRQPRMSWRLS